MEFTVPGPNIGPGRGYTSPGSLMLSNQPLPFASIYKSKSTAMEWLLQTRALTQHSRELLLSQTSHFTVSGVRSISSLNGQNMGDRMSQPLELWLPWCQDTLGHTCPWLKWHCEKANQRLERSELYLDYKLFEELPEVFSELDTLPPKLLDYHPICL